MTEPVHRLFHEAPPGPEADIVDHSYVEVARRIAAICATRALLMITVITGAVIWGGAAWDPQRDRLYVAIAFSLVFVLPQIALYFRKG